ncbi:monovalent cation/H+ antiporter complex subunit F [Corynebacterium hansenii]|uniref:Monovalent cation/H+ antiporter complex subunit F n=1 Tax=Corynebacterium hansenii TaxID=394964 RepID=A0ABV7ZPJ8_9CORY|nr:putative monovalent cation/H+ antiporter subunit F [Corynebacterium hansenii]
MDPQLYSTLLAVTAGLYFVASLIALGRLLAGPNSMDRLVSLESMIAMSQGMLAVYIAWSMDTSVAYAMLVIALLGFISSLSVARFRVPDKRPRATVRASSREASREASRDAAQQAAREEDLKHVDEKEDHF